MKSPELYSLCGAAYFPLEFNCELSASKWMTSKLLLCAGSRLLISTDTMCDNYHANLHEYPNVPAILYCLVELTSLPVRLVFIFLHDGTVFNSLTFQSEGTQPLNELFIVCTLAEDQHPY